VQVRQRRKERTERARVALQDELYMFIGSTGGGYDGIITMLNDALKTRRTDNSQAHHELAASELFNM
jgi:hypothetical protein